LNLDDIKQLAESFAAHHADPMGVEAIAGCSELHVENGRYDVHLVQVQMDMESGKRIDLYLDSCGDTQRIADWQDCKNYELKLDDPRDPSRMRLTNDKVRESTDREEMRKLVNNHLEQQTINGTLTSRSDVLHELQSLGFEIKRQNKKTISIKSPDLNQNIRLTGAIFHESFTGIEGVRGTIEAGQGRGGDDYRRQYEAAQARLAESNQKRIKRISKKLHIDFEKNPRGIQACNLQDTTAYLDSLAFELSAAHRSRGMGSAAVQHPEPKGSAECLSDSAISGKPVRHRSASEHITRPEWKYLDQNTEIGTSHDITNHIETIALRMKQLFSRSPAEDDGVAKGSDISSDDIGY